LNDSLGVLVVVSGRPFSSPSTLSLLYSKALCQIKTRRSCRPRTLSSTFPPQVSVPDFPSLTQTLTACRRSTSRGVVLCNNTSTQHLTRRATGCVTPLEANCRSSRVVAKTPHLTFPYHRSSHPARESGSIQDGPRMCVCTERGAFLHRGSPKNRRYRLGVSDSRAYCSFALRAGRAVYNDRVFFTYRDVRARSRFFDFCFPSHGSQTMSYHENRTFFQQNVNSRYRSARSSPFDVFPRPRYDVYAQRRTDGTRKRTHTSHTKNNAKTHQRT